MLGSFLPFSASGSGRSAAALLKKSMTWPRSTTGLSIGLVLAELVVGGVEVGEIDAVESLDVGADRLRIVERGGDQVVEIDRFDVERLRIWAQPSRKICTTSA